MKHWMKRFWRFATGRKPPCDTCGIDSVGAFTYSYNWGIAVIWFCDAHRLSDYDQRALSGDLRDDEFEEVEPATHQQGGHQP